MVAAKVNMQNNQCSITVVSSYFKYNMPTPCFIERLHTILEYETHVLIGADVNAHSQRWYCDNRNDRSLLVEDMIDSHDLKILNNPMQLKTYDRAAMGS